MFKNDLSDLACSSHLFLSVFDGQFEPVEVHPFSMLVDRTRLVMVEEDLQLRRRPGVVKQSSGELLTLGSEFLKKKIITLK